MKKSLGILLLAVLLPAAALAQAASSPCVDASTFEEGHRQGGIVGGAQKVIGGPSTTVNAPPDANICALTPRQKLNVWVQRSYSPSNLLTAGINAAIWQATDDDPRGYGQGWEAYGARYGAEMAQTESFRFFQSFLLPSILKQDPRYFRKGSGGFGSRAGYSLSRVLVTRSDAGRQQFNFSAVGAAFAAAGLSNTYLPDVNRDAGRTMASAGLALASYAGWNLLSEFGPDIWNKLRRKKKN